MNITLTHIFLYIVIDQLNIYIYIMINLVYLGGNSRYNYVNAIKHSSIAQTEV